MVPSGGLSNPRFQDLLQCLTSHKSRKDPGKKQKSKAGWPDGRRKFGTVSGAILEVLAQSGAEVSVKVIRERVEELLGGSVSGFPVSDYLLVRSKGPKPLFERTRHGRYRVLR